MASCLSLTLVHVSFVILCLLQRPLQLPQPPPESLAVRPRPRGHIPPASCEAGIWGCCGVCVPTGGEPRGSDPWSSRGAPCKHGELQGSTHGVPCSVPCPAPRFSYPLSPPELAPGSSKPYPGALPGCQPLLPLSWTAFQLGFLQPEGRKKRGSEEQPSGARHGDTEGSHVARGQLLWDARPGKAWPGHTCS